MRLKPTRHANKAANIIAAFGCAAAWFAPPDPFGILGMAAMAAAIAAMALVMLATAANPEPKESDS